MSGHCEIFDHTADVGLRAWADTLEELFEVLAEALAEMICPRHQVRPVQTRRIEVHAEDREAIAVDFLWEIMSAIQFGHFAIATVRIDQAGETSLSAELVGEPYDPHRHELATEVKAVTYHQLRLVRKGRRWTARVILDL